MVSGRIPFSVHRNASRTPAVKTAHVARLLPLMVLMLPVVVQAQYQFEYFDNGDRITINNYLGGPDGGVIIPSTIIGKPVTKIALFAFAHKTFVTSVTIPASVTEIGDRAFYECTNMTAIIVDPLNPVYSSTDGILYNKGQTTLIQCPGGKSGSVTIPNTVIDIVAYAFHLCHNLTEVYFYGNDPPLGGAWFDGNNTAIIYYLSCATGWGSTFGGRPTAVWTPPLPYTYTIDNSTVTITSYHCPTGATIIPTMIDNLPVTRIGNFAFYNKSDLTSITIPDSVTSIGDGAFGHCGSLTSVTIPDSVTRIGSVAFFSCLNLTNVTIGNSVTNVGNSAFQFCTNLAGVYSQGNAPSVGSQAFAFASKATIYYLPGTTGWGSTFGGRPTVLWNPQALTSGASFGVLSNQFGFTITGASGLVVVVEADTNPDNPVWSPVGTNTLISGSSYFSDPQWTNYPARFYRLRSP